MRQRKNNSEKNMKKTKDQMKKVCVGFLLAVISSKSAPGRQIPPQECVAEKNKRDKEFL